MKKSKEQIIDMEQRGGVFVPARVQSAKRNTQRGLTQGGSYYPRPPDQPHQIGKILEGMVTDFFKVIRREMLK